MPFTPLATGIVNLHAPASDPSESTEPAYSTSTIHGPRCSEFKRLLRWRPPGPTSKTGLLRPLGIHAMVILPPCRPGRSRFSSRLPGSGLTGYQDAQENHQESTTNFHVAVLFCRHRSSSRPKEDHRTKVRQIASTAGKSQQHETVKEYLHKSRPQQYPQRAALAANRLVPQ